MIARIFASNIAHPRPETSALGRLSLTWRTPIILASGAAVGLRAAKIILAVIWAAGQLAGTVAWGQEATLPPMSQHRDENGEVLKRGDASIAAAIAYNSDANANLDGGMTRGATYLQRIGLIGDADLNRLLGWRGASAHISIHAISGIGLSGRHVGNVLTVSGLEAEPAVRLFNLWIEQEVGKSATVRVGQFTAGQEFGVSSTAALFINSTFGWPASFAANLPSGGPAYPLAAPGFRLAASPRKDLAIRVAIFAGDPAGRGSADPQRRDLHGFNGFRLKGKPFLIAEISHHAAGENPAWSLTVGGWMLGGEFGDTAPADRPIKHNGNWSVYAMADGRLWESGNQILRGFLRVTASPSDRNPLDLYVDGGISLTAPLRRRSEDTFGIAVAVARISPRWRSRVNAQTAPSSAALLFPSYEGAIEASWNWKLSRQAYLQPNVQLILNPAAAVLARASTERSPSQALIFGLRSSLRL